MACKYVSGPWHGSYYHKCVGANWFLQCCKTFSPTGVVWINLVWLKIGGPVKPPSECSERAWHKLLSLNRNGECASNKHAHRHRHPLNAKLNRGETSHECLWKWDLRRGLKEFRLCFRRDVPEPRGPDHKERDQLKDSSQERMHLFVFLRSQSMKRKSGLAATFHSPAAHVTYSLCLQMYWFCLLWQAQSMPRMWATTFHEWIPFAVSF